VAFLLAQVAILSMGRHCAMEAMPHVADAAWRGQLSGRQGHGVVKT